MEVFTPSNLLAGRIPVKRGHEREAVFHAAAELLGTEQIRFVMGVHDGHAWYLAAPALEFGNQPDSYTPLAAALPDARGHAGDGGYFVRTSASSMVAVVKTETGLKTFSGPEKQVQRFFELEGVKVVHNPTTAQRAWESLDGERRRLAAKVLHRAVIAGIVANLAGGSLWVGASSYAAQRDNGMEQLLAQQKDALRATAQQLNAGSGNFFLREHAQLASEVLRYPNARIRQYKVEGGKSSWLVRLPEQVPLDRLRAMGGELVSRPLGDGMQEVEKKGK